MSETGKGDRQKRSKANQCEHRKLEWTGVDEQGKDVAECTECGLVDTLSNWMDRQSARDDHSPR